MMTSREHAALPFLSYVQMCLSHQSWKALCGRQSAEEEGGRVSSGQEDKHQRETSEVLLGERPV